MRVPFSRASSPPSSETWPASARSSVVLPAPFGPASASRSRRSTLNETPSKRTLPESSLRREDAISTAMPANYPAPMATTDVRQTVLVAEDDEDIRTLVAYRMEKAGYAVLQARDGEEAVSLALEHRPDLAIIDVMMPRLDGYEATRQL